MRAKVNILLSKFKCHFAFLLVQLLCLCLDDCDPTAAPQCHSTDMKLLYGKQASDQTLPIPVTVPGTWPPTPCTQLSTPPRQIFNLFCHTRYKLGAIVWSFILILCWEEEVPSLRPISRSWVVRFSTCPLCAACVWSELIKYTRKSNGRNLTFDLLEREEICTRFSLHFYTKHIDWTQSRES